MADLIIRLRRPATLSDGEETTWVESRVRALRAGLTRSTEATDAIALRVPVPPSAATEDRLARLLLEGTHRAGDLRATRRPVSG